MPLADQGCVCALVCRDRGEILRDVTNPSMYLILTEWESMKHLNNWFETPFYTTIMKDLNATLQAPTSYRILRTQKDEVFLL
jgi:heme-degrading monooxygenase HmoA